MKKIALLAALAFAGTAQAAMIDDFNSTGPYTLNAAQSNTAVGTASGTLGALARTLTSTTSGSDTNVQIDTATNTGIYAHSQSSGVTGTSYIEYTLSNVDLTAGFLDAFRIKLTAADLNGTLTLYVSDGAANATQTLTTNNLLLASGLAFPAYGDFLFSSFAGVDFTSVNVIRLGVDGSATAALDVSIDNFETVCTARTSNGGSGTNPANGDCTPHNNTPEPATLGLLGLGLLGLGAARRYRKS
jgi:hypothetical protein